ncbi:hypothetical protein ACFLRM_02660 [Acidobacteriota bacterium]
MEESTDESEWISEVRAETWMDVSKTRRLCPSEPKVPPSGKGQTLKESLNLKALKCRRRKPIFPGGKKPPTRELNEEKLLIDKLEKFIIQ